MHVVAFYPNSGGWEGVAEGGGRVENIIHTYLWYNHNVNVMFLLIAKPTLLLLLSR